MVQENSTNQQQHQFTTADVSQQNGGGLDLQTLVNIFLGKWYIFLMCVIVALGLASCYILRTPKTYVQKSSVLVLDQKAGGGMGSMASAFADISGFKGLTSSSVQNEKEFLISRTVINAVVDHLGLQYGYYEPKLMRSDELYDHSPIRLIPIEVDNNMEKPVAFKVKFIENDSLNFAYETKDTTFVCPFDQEIELPKLGLVKIHLLKHSAHAYLEAGKDVVNVVALPRELAVSAYQNSITCELANKESAALYFSCTATSPTKAADILNTLVDEYNKITIDSKNAVLDNALEFIGQRVEAVGEELAQVDSKLEALQRNERTVNPQLEAGNFLTQNAAQEQKIIELEIQLRLTKDVRAVIDQSSNGNFQLLPMNVGINNTVLNSQISKYDELLMRYQQLKASSSDKSPIVLDRAAELQALLDNISMTSADVQRQLELSIREQRSLTAKNMDRVSDATSTAFALTSIQREQVVKSELYNYLLQKTEENAIMKSMTESNIRLIDAAYGNVTPVAPGKTKILLIGFILGLILPFGFYYLKDLLYTKVRGRSDVTNVVKAPIVGEIPRKPKKLINQTIFVEAGSNNQISEAFRNMRANLSFLSFNHKVQVIGMASSMAGEGKSFVSLNLAMAFAISNKRVLMIDCDLRKMATTRTFKMRGKIGLSEYLAGTESNLMELIQESNYENLSILPGGVIPPNPAELLMGDRFDQAIAELRTKFDYIIIDTPPVDIVADTSISNRVVDATIFVVRVGKLDRRQLAAIQEIYQTGRLKNMAIVINDVDYDALNYSMGYSGYGKAYGYRYYGSSYYNYYASYEEGNTKHTHSYGLYRNKKKRKED